MITCRVSMDRKALIVIIAALTLLVILLLVQYNQQALAPTPESAISATAGGPIRPTVAGIQEMPENTSFSMDLSNVTITPTAEPEKPTAVATPHHSAVTATPHPPTSTPQPSAMAPWSPMSPMSPMGPAPKLSWNNTLRH
jgi:hypothetical protein